ncbi:MAG: extracellular solute-binding protein [Chloroflexaceae bacterium]|nr:extracellular solute-binding protein [Chloroflexaceae bacterium]
MPTLESPPTTANQPTAVSANPLTLPPTPTPEPLPLTLWVAEEGAAFERVQQLAAEYGAASNLAIAVVPKRAAALRADLLAAQLIGVGLPDMIWADQDVLAELLIDGQLQPTATLDPAQVVSAALTGATADGHLWGVPLLLDNFLLLLYNRQLIGQPPTNSDDLIIASRGTQQGNRFGIAANWTAARWAVPWLAGFGGALTTPDGNQPTLNTPQMISTLNLLRELQRAAPPAETTTTSPLEPFAAGNVAMALDGTWALSVYQQAPVAPDLGVAPLPRVSATGQPAATLVDVTYLLLPATLEGELLAAVQGFAAYLSMPPIQAQLARDLQRAPALRASLTDQLLTDDPLLMALATQAEAAISVPPTRGTRCALAAIDTQLPLLTEGQMPAEEIATVMQRQADGCITQ